MKKSVRLFRCARCHCQVLICTDCDRGNIYCSPCSELAGVESHREACKRYQSTSRGKRNHAERQKRYRQKKKKVTDESSIDSPPNDLLTIVTSEQENVEEALGPVDMHCHFCGKCCSAFMRSGFLRHHTNDESKIPSFFARVP